MKLNQLKSTINIEELKFIIFISVKGNTGKQYFFSNVRSKKCIIIITQEITYNDYFVHCILKEFIFNLQTR